MRVLVHPANEHETVGAKRLLQRLPFIARLQLLLFDSGYQSDAFLHWCQHLFGVRTEIRKRSDPVRYPVPQRWIVERTFGWLNRMRRLSKDYEQRPDVGESFVYVSMIHLMLRRLCP